MRAFRVAWQAIISLYNDLFLLVGLNILWWLTGGIFAGAALVAAFVFLQIGGPVWLAPFLAIPAGPALAALATVTHQSARELHADRDLYFEGLRRHWRQALALNAISMAILAVLILNVFFYVTNDNAILRALTFLFAYLVLFWLSVQIYLFPVLAGLTKPSALGALRIAAAAAFASPLFTILLLLLAALITGISVVLPILIFLTWPAHMALMGEHSLLLFLERAGIKPEKPS